MKLSSMMRDLDVPARRRRRKRAAPKSPIRFLTTSKGRGWYVVAPGVMKGPYDSMVSASAAYRRMR